MSPRERVGRRRMSSVTLALVSLIWRRRAEDAGGIVDLMIALLTCVMASPIAAAVRRGRVAQVSLPHASRGHGTVRIITSSDFSPVSTLTVERLPMPLA
jgi:hypothetical protein